MDAHGRRTRGSLRGSMQNMQNLALYLYIVGRLRRLLATAAVPKGGDLSPVCTAPAQAQPHGTGQARATWQLTPH